MEKIALFNVASHPQKILSLCTGIGGLDIGVSAALRGNCRTVLMVERENFAAGILAQRMQDGWLDDAPIWSDVATLDSRAWRGKVDGVIGSYPCQSISNAGKRKGTADERWLWPHFARIIEDIQPSWCFFENVAQHVNVGLDAVWADLRRLGFDVEAGLFEAAEVSACHIRRRLFILAKKPCPSLGATQGNGECEDVADAERRAIGQIARGVACKAGQDESERLISPTRPLSRLSNVANAGGKRSGEMQERAWRWVADTDWRDRWRSSAGVRRVSNGCPNRVVKLRALGNAVVPECARHAFVTLASRLDTRHQARYLNIAKEESDGAFGQEALQPSSEPPILRLCPFWEDWLTV